jgi:hypothetical protein
MPVIPRILNPCFMVNVKLTVVICNTPPNKTSDKSKDVFYRALDSITKDKPQDTIPCFLGDFNAKVGNSQLFSPNVLGEHGLGQQNKNRELLIDFTVSNNLEIGGTVFANLDVHKYSWIFTNFGCTQNQIEKKYF